jgi:hypothetical protein
MNVRVGSNVFWSRVQCKFRIAFGYEGTESDLGDKRVPSICTFSNFMGHEFLIFCMEKVDVVECRDHMI